MLAVCVSVHAANDKGRFISAVSAKQMLRRDFYLDIETWALSTFSSLPLSLCLCDSVSLTPTLSPSLCLSLALSDSLYSCLTPLRLCVSLSLSVSVSLSLSRSLRLSLSLPLSTRLSPSHYSVPFYLKVNACCCFSFFCQTPCTAKIGSLNLGP